MLETIDLLEPPCDECGEWHEPMEPCEECGATCEGHFYGCSFYDYCGAEPEI